MSETITKSAPAPIENAAKNADTTPSLDSKTSNEVGKAESKQSSAVPTPEETADIAKAVEGKLATELRKFKVKIDNTEAEVDEEELIRGYQLRQASDKRFKEATELRKQNEQFIELLKTNPRAVLQHPSIGHDVRKLAEEVLAEALEEEMLDPKDKEIRQLRKQRDEAVAAQKKLDEQRASEAHERMVATHTENYNKLMGEALQVSGLPDNARTRNRMLDYLMEAVESGYDLNAKDVAKLVKEDYIKDVQTLFGGSEAKIIADMLGEEGLKKVRTFDMERIKSPAQIAPTPPLAEQGEAKVGEKKAVERVKVSNFFKDLRNKIEAEEPRKTNKNKYY